VFWVATLAATAAIERVGAAKKEEGKLPGDLGFDPLGLAKGATAEEYRRLEEQELSHGRTAMLAISVFAAEEALFKGPVVENTPLFFLPAASFVTPEGAEALNFAGFEAAPFAARGCFAAGGASFGGARFFDGFTGASSASICCTSSSHS